MARRTAGHPWHIQISHEKGPTHRLRYRLAGHTVDFWAYPRDEIAPWVPFLVTEWRCGISLNGRVIFVWRRSACRALLARKIAMRRDRANWHQATWTG